MGWFWAESLESPGQSSSRDGGLSPPPGCPMHQKSADAMTPSPPPPTASGCPVPHGSSSIDPPASAPPSACPVKHTNDSDSQSQTQSTFSKLNPLNYMFRDLPQDRAPSQTIALPTSRDPSTIPRGDGSGQNWEYPSPQQMYHALLRKGYADTDVTAVESMVGVHNFLNEGAWAEILDWERRFAGGLLQGWRLCRRGEENFEGQARRLGCERQVFDELQPSLVRFQGRPQDMTPKAAMIQVMGWLYPGAFSTEPPFDRHDWYVSRNVNGQQKEVRYIIDYYSGEPEPTGEPVFYLDVRPAFTPTGAAERALRWGCDTWWKASGGDIREAYRQRSTK